MTLLRLDNVTRSFGGILAVDRLDLAIKAGQLLCLIGPNGAGKSTVFKLIMGLITPSSGNIWFAGRDITHLQPFERVRLGVNMKYQATRVFTTLTVAQNLDIAQRRVGSKNKVLDWALARLGLAGSLARPAGDLSYGQQHWLEICMTLANAPTLVLMDEPTAGMTPEETMATAHFLRDLNAQGTSIVVVEHDMGFIREIAGQVTVLHQGRAFKHGSIGDIEADPDVQRIYLGENP